MGAGIVFRARCKCRGSGYRCPGWRRSTSSASPENVPFALATSPGRPSFGCGAGSHRTYYGGAFNRVLKQPIEAVRDIAITVVRACHRLFDGRPGHGFPMAVDNMLAAVTDRTKVVFATNPSNPTGHTRCEVGSGA